MVFFVFLFSFEEIHGTAEGGAEHTEAQSCRAAWPTVLALKGRWPLASFSALSAGALGEATEVFPVTATIFPSRFVCPLIFVYFFLFNILCFSDFSAAIQTKP